MTLLRRLAYALLLAVIAQSAAAEESSLALPATTLTFSSAFIAEDLGLWEKQGLTVKSVIIQGVGSPNAVIAGSVDFTVTTASTFARAAQHGQPVLAVANLLDRPMMELVMRKDIAEAGGWKEGMPVEERAKLMRGHTFAVDGIYTNLHAYLQFVALKAGLQPDKDLRVTAVPGPNMPAALASGAIDGFSSSPPWTNGAVADGKAVMIASSPHGDVPELVPFDYGVLMTRAALCRDKPAVCRKMVQGFVAAADFIHTHQAETFALLKKRFPQMSDELLKSSLETLRSATPRPPVVTLAGLENAENFNVRSGVVKPEDRLKSFEGLYTNEFVK